MEVHPLSPMSTRPAPVVGSSKRPLREVLSAGLAREDPDVATTRLGTNALYDVLDSSGAFFGVCFRTHSTSEDEHVFLEPKAMRGVRVTKPMTVCTCVNSTRLAATLGAVLSYELCR